MKKIVGFILFAFAFASAGELSDHQMEKIFQHLKKKNFTEAAAAAMDSVFAFENSPEVKTNTIAYYSGKLKEFTQQHGIPVGYTLWRTRRLSKNMEEVVFQVNCQKSAWMLEFHEFVNDAGKHYFSEVRYVTEDDIFKAYVK